MKIQPKKRVKKPAWLRRRLPSGPEFEQIRSLVGKRKLHTVCQEAKCPNIWECFSNHTATFLIMGNRCTRKCRFCAVAHRPVEPPDPDEPDRVAKTTLLMGLKYVVITSVTRDDVADGGASYFARTINKIRQRLPDTLIEVLIPDLQGSRRALHTILEARPDVLNHNIETVPRLYQKVRPQADYRRSLTLIQRASTFDRHLATKSGLMLGLGETADEIQQTLRDLLNTGCKMLTLGQYLQPTSAHLQVDRFVTPDEFERWKKDALQMGFSEVASGPFVRSSYHARELFLPGSITSENAS